MRILKFIFFGFLFTPFLFRLDVTQYFSDDAILFNKEVKSIGQTFVAQHDNIYQLKISMNNPQLTSNKRPLVFQLKESPQAKNSLVNLLFSSENVGANYDLRMQFVPISDSKNKLYYFEISSPLAASSSALEIRQSKKDIYQGGSAYINQEKTSGDLAFKVYYKVSLTQFIKDSGADFLKRLNQDVPFIMIYALLILVTTALTVYSFLKR